jgi:hypothetical protein
MKNIGQYKALHIHSGLNSGGLTLGRIMPLHYVLKKDISELANLIRVWVYNLAGCTNSENRVRDFFGN